MANLAQTPMRSVPGEFLNTPAVASRFHTQIDPIRLQLFGAQEARTQTNPTGSRALDAPTQGGQALQPVGQTVPPDSPLARAAYYLNNALDGDDMYPVLDAYCKYISSEYDNGEHGSKSAPFVRTALHQIPDAVFEQYNRAEVSTLMGLFAELNHAWVTIDNALFLWDYRHGDPQLLGFEDNPNTITAVRLVAPKPRVFREEITHVLVVATTRDIFLLGMGAQTSANGGTAMSLYQTKVSLPIKGSDANILAGSKDGRIFFAGAGAAIHELRYQHEEGWFSGRTSSINHTHASWVAAMPKAPWGSNKGEQIIDLQIDDSRNLLYCLSDTSTIRTYHLVAPYTLTRVIEKTKADCLRDITHTMSTISPLLTERMSIVSISPVTAIEDAKIHLMALTNNGVRLYMSATSATSYSLGQSGPQVPQSMQLQAIKFPPSIDGARTGGREGGATYNDYVSIDSLMLSRSNKGIRFAPGYFLGLVCKPERPDRDQLFVAAPDTGRIKNMSMSVGQNLRYYEQCSLIDLGGRAEDIGMTTGPFGAANQPRGFANELAVQFDVPASEFAILTNTGVHVIRRQRLVDVFAVALRDAAGDEGLRMEWNRFEQLYGQLEATTAALAVACGQASSGRGAGDQATEHKARKAYINFGGSPTLTVLVPGQLPTVDWVTPSIRHAALSLYLSRLVRTLWRANVVTLGRDGAGALSVDSTVPRAKLMTVQDQVHRLDKILDAEKSFIQGLSGPADLQRATNRNEEITFRAEHQAMRAVMTLMSSILQGISFVLMLFDERVTDIYTRLDETDQGRLRHLTFEHLFCQEDGKDLAKVLVKAIVNRNIENGSNVETVADTLRRRCEGFCSAEDVVVFKAQELLKQAAEEAAPGAALQRSLSQFSLVAGSLSDRNLEGAIGQYIDLRYYAGAIQLCLTVAQEKDRGNEALSWIHDRRPAGDAREAAFAGRKRCYDLIHHVLQELDAQESAPAGHGNSSTLAIKRSEAYLVVNDSKDEVFHIDLYNWYVDSGRSERLLKIDSPYVIPFLQQLSTTDARHSDLLCRYYTGRSMWYQAACVQYELSQSDFGIGIKDRLRLLSRAKANVNVVTQCVSRQALQMLSHNIAELLEVAHIQDDLLERLEVDDKIPEESRDLAKQVLNGPIQSLTNLFNNYADQAGYHDLCLMIYHAADFRDSTSILQTWQSLIQKTHDDVVALQEDPAENAPQPYEALVAKMQEVCHRTSRDSLVFPVPSLLPVICKYAIEHGQDSRIGADPNWPIELLLSLGVSHDLVSRCLENVFQAQDIPFRGPHRLRVVEWIVHTIKGWVKELTRAGRNDGALETWVTDLLDQCRMVVDAADRQNVGGMGVRELAAEILRARGDVVGLTVAGGTGGRGLAASFGTSWR